jgi:hypothetical protein
LNFSEPGKFFLKFLRTWFWLVGKRIKLPHCRWCGSGWLSVGPNPAPRPLCLPHHGGAALMDGMGVIERPQNIEASAMPVSQQYWSSQGCLESYGESF